MAGRSRILTFYMTFIFCFLTLFGPGAAVATSAIAQTKSSGRAEAPAHANLPVPRYHRQPPKGPLPSVLPWQQFAGNPFAENAYFFGARIRRTLYQLPCYCYCDKSLGHTCLLDCIVKPDRHAAVCPLCQEEILFAYERVKAGKSAPEIRKEIIAGKYAKADLAKFRNPPRS